LSLASVPGRSLGTINECVRGPWADARFRPGQSERLDATRRGAETAIAEGDAGLATSTLSDDDDDDGVVAPGAQSLLVAPRSA
jgi:hypothetical protein